MAAYPVRLERARECVPNATTIRRLNGETDAVELIPKGPAVNRRGCGPLEDVELRLSALHLVFNNFVDLKIPVHP